MTRRLLGVGALVVVLLAGCGGGDDDTAASPSPDGSAPVDADAEDADTGSSETTGSQDGSSNPDATPASFTGYLSDGDCFDHRFDDGGDPDYSRPPLIVDCEPPHDREVVTVHTLEEGADAAYPDEDVWDDLFQEVCVPAFNEFLGIDGSPSALGGFRVQPTEEEWDDGARTKACVLYLPDAQLAGSLRGVGQDVLPASFPADAPVPEGLVLTSAADIEDSYSPTERFAREAGIDTEGFFGATFEGGDAGDTKAALEETFAASDWEVTLEDAWSGDVATAFYALHKQDAELIVETWELEGGHSRVHYFYLPD
ncbi:MAG: septum formation family protein [Acidimicrobiales bacterium]|nr:septum formation family protein [Acidimicrobiales bacterium]